MTEYEQCEKCEKHVGAACVREDCPQHEGECMTNITPSHFLMTCKGNALERSDCVLHDEPCGKCAPLYYEPVVVDEVCHVPLVEQAEEMEIHFRRETDAEMERHCNGLCDDDAERDAYEAAREARLIKQAEIEAYRALHSEAVDRPPHYTVGGFEAIDVIRAKLTPEQYIGYLKGNILKYVMRCEYKGRRDEDLRKTEWYASELAEFLASVEFAKNEVW